MPSCQRRTCCCSGRCRQCVDFVAAVVVNGAYRQVEDVAKPAAAVDDKKRQPTKQSQGKELTREGDATAEAVTSW